MTINVVIGSVNVSDYVQHVEVWRKATEGIGRSEVTLLNYLGRYNGTFSADMPLSISFLSALLLKGYLDISQSQITHQTSGRTALEEYLTLPARDLGQDLQNKLYANVYSALADDIIADLLSHSGCEVTFTSPHTAPTIYHDTQQNLAGDAIREILETIDYDGFVDENKHFNMFPHDGSSNHPSSGITLKSVLNDMANNILKVVDYDELDSIDLRNYIIVFGDQVTDGWTELNANGWQSGDIVAYFNGNNNYPNIISDYMGTSPSPRFGIAAIKAATQYPTAPTSTVGAKLTFPRYNWNLLDYSQIPNTVQNPLYLSVIIYLKTNSPTDNTTIYLTDDQGYRILWQPGAASLPYSNQWNTLSVPISPDVTIGSQPGWFNGYWDWDPTVSHPTNIFSWKILRVEVVAGPLDTSGHHHEYLLIDGLTVPNVQLLAVSQLGAQASQQAYKVRKLVINKTEISSQIELQQYADSICTKRINPLKRLHLWARGDAGLIGGAWKWLPGYQATVNIPEMGINNEAWRFMEIHHVIERLVEYGWSHLVELQLVPAAAKFETLRWAYGTQSQTALIRTLRDRLKALEQNAVTASAWYQGLPAPYV